MATPGAARALGAVQMLGSDRSLVIPTAAATTTATFDPTAPARIPIPIATPIAPRGGAAAGTEIVASGVRLADLYDMPSFTDEIAADEDLHLAVVTKLATTIEAIEVHFGCIRATVERMLSNVSQAQRGMPEVIRALRFLRDITDRVDKVRDLCAEARRIPPK